MLHGYLDFLGVMTSKTFFVLYTVCFSTVVTNSWYQHSGRYEIFGVCKINCSHKYRVYPGLSQTAARIAATSSSALSRHFHGTKNDKHTFYPVSVHHFLQFVRFLTPKSVSDSALQCDFYCVEVLYLFWKFVTAVVKYSV